MSNVLILMVFTAAAVAAVAVGLIGNWDVVATLGAVTFGWVCSEWLNEWRWIKKREVRR